MESEVREKWRSAYFDDMLDLSDSDSDSYSYSDSHAPMELSPKKFPTAEERAIQRQEWIKEARKNNDDTYKKWIDQKEKTLKQHWHMRELKIPINKLSEKSNCPPLKRPKPDDESSMESYSYEDWMRDAVMIPFRTAGNEEIGEYTDRHLHEEHFWDTFGRLFVHWDPLVESFEAAYGTGTANLTQIYSLKLTTEGMNSLEVYGLIHVHSNTFNFYQVIFDRERDNCLTLTEKVSAYGTGTANLTQIYSLKLTTEGMNSLEVYGLIHVHSDTFDFYQVIFDRERDNCLTLTEKDPYLVLTGPALPTLSTPNTIHIHGTLKLKSTTGSDDKYLSVSICCGDGKVSGIHKLKEGDVDFQSEEEYLSHVSKCCLPGKPCVHTPQDIGKHYLLEMTRGFIPFSLVATITVRVNNGGGSLVQNCCFTASTASLPDLKVVLFDSRDWKVSSVRKNGIVQLSRRTIGVESGGTLIVCIEHRDKGILKEVKFSSPGVDDVESVDMVRNETVEVDLCTIDFKVIWSKYFRRFNAA
ncbi:hypothetical protein OROMI_014942 [Orobanche minor]